MSGGRTETEENQEAKVKKELWELQALRVLKERGELLAPQDSQVPKASWAPQDRRVQMEKVELRGNKAAKG